MIRGTTPTFTLNINDPTNTLDLRSAQNVYVTFEQGRHCVTKTGDDLSVQARSVSGWLTQQESLSFEAGKPATVQVNWTYLDMDGTVRRAATKVQDVRVNRQLLSEVLA